MIAKAKAISHGINDLRYITGESQHKKHPEKIYRVVIIGEFKCTVFPIQMYKKV